MLLMKTIALLLIACIIDTLDAENSDNTETELNGLKGTAKTTRYWDCAKPSCSWKGKASVTKPVLSCAKDGKSLVHAETKSGADGGNAFTCTNNQPWVSESDPDLAYGFAAFKLAEGENRACCTCMELKFKDEATKGKRMIVQVTNTGNDLDEGYQFDLQIPGGGIGAVDGCKKQFNADESWGEQYGGVNSREGCSELPTQLQKGCRWRFDKFFEGSNNPSVDFEEIEFFD